MTTVLVSLALLLLTTAIVLLYAMMGELASRVPDSADTHDYVTALQDYRPGASPADWPESLVELSVRPRSALLVLSPVCSSCSRVAGELAGRTSNELESVGLVISSGNAATAKEFIVQHELQGLPHLIDEGGNWVRDNFGVNMSPTALVMEKGVLIEGYSFGKFESLRREMTKNDRKEHQHGQLQG